MNQLVSVDDKLNGKVYNYTYDAGGNLINETVTDSNGTTSNDYEYNNSNWGDVLTSYNGQSITYDEIGNPLTYRDGMSFEWENGRILKKINTSDKSVQMSYDSNGMRTQKSVDGVKTNYYYDSNKNLIALVKGNDTLLFYYDSEGSATSFSYNGTMYFYVKNLQGDVVRIIDLSGTEVASYVYDAWGNIKDTKGDSTVRELNPIRYRGYVYDTETSLYYLQSRYYDPFTGRFLNADIYCDTNTGTPLSTNIFAYCENNPISNADESGYIAANVIGAVIGGIVGAVGGYFLTNWLADKLNLHGWKRNVFVWGLSAVIGAAAAVIGYFIGPYVAKLATKLASYVANLIQKGKVAIAKLTNTIRNKSGITKLIVKNLVKNASKLKYTKTAASHLPSRPYMKSTHIIKNIMQAANPVADKSLKYGLKWVVKGSYNGTKGIWELVIDVSKKRIVHFLFKKG
nr:RHS repeat-associated core domain-containing protein [uncultured Ruminococcus sp.]